MPVNKNALIRYRVIDQCLRNRYRRWTIEDLVDACSDALYDMEGIRKGVSLRTVQADIQMMRSGKLGYNAPIEVYDQKYYRYADPNYSIDKALLEEEDIRLIEKAIALLEMEENRPESSELELAFKQVKKVLLKYFCSDIATKVSLKFNHPNFVKNLYQFLFLIPSLLKACS